MPLNSNPSLARKASLKTRPFSFNLRHQVTCMLCHAFQVWYSMCGSQQQLSSRVCNSQRVL